MALNTLKRWLASEWAVVIALLALAAFFRFYQLNTIPPGLHYDEAGEGLDALNMLEKGFRVFSTTQGGREPLFAYLLAAAFSIWGPQVIIGRGIAALAGVLAVGGAYLLTRELFRPLMPHRARWLATLTALGLAVSYWQIHLTRIGLRHVLLPGLMSAELYFLWRSFRTGRRLHFVLTGLLLGASLYTYLSARFIPIFLGLFLLLEGLIRAAEGRPTAALWRRHWQNLLLTIVAAGIISAPLGYYFLTQNPDEFLGRANQVSIFNPVLNQGHLWGALQNSALHNYGAIAFFGDEDGLVNLPGRPMFAPLTALAFALGLAITLWRIREPVYLFVALWWPVMMLPSVLTYDRVPRFMRAMGTVPGLYIFPALGLLTASVWLWQRRWRWGRLAAVALPLGVFAISGGLTFHDYFLQWGTSQLAADKFYVPYTKLAHKMVAEGRPDELWVYPTDLRINYPRRHRYILRFIGYQKLPPEKFLAIDEQKMFAELSRQTAGISNVVLVDMKTGLQKEADAKHVLPFLLEKYGTLNRTLQTNDFDLLYYSLDKSPIQFAPPDNWQPLDVRYQPGLRLLATAFGDASGVNDPDAAIIPSGETIWATLHWQPDGPLPEDYQASLRLVDDTGRILSQIDNPLSSRWHIPPTGWHPAEDIFDYYLLPVPPGTLPGTYRLEAALYSPATLQPLPASVSGDGGHSTVDIGTVQIAPPRNPLPALETSVTLNAAWLPGLMLVGTEPLPESFRPGDRLSVPLVWHSTVQLRQTAQLEIWLQNSETAIPLRQNVTIGGEQFPTSMWRAGETVRQWLTVQLPADLPAGAYTLALRSPATAAVSLGDIAINGRPRTFTLPENLPYHPDAVIGNRVRLGGLSIDAPAANQLNLTLYWQALAPMDTSYTVFVHILDETGKIVAQRDQLPRAGDAPTTGWLKNEVVADPYTFTLPDGTYRLAVGLYNAATGARLSIPGTADNRLILSPTVTISP